MNEIKNNENSKKSFSLENSKKSFSLENSKKSLSLTENQSQAYDKICAGKNILLTGCPGSGKSFIIKKFFAEYSSSQKIAITSTTGISALGIGGVTLHSYLGIGLGNQSADILIEKVTNNKSILWRWQNLDTLIIDEVSMLSPELFDKLELMARELRQEKGGGNLPFGGIQLVLSGDMLQLPVIGNSKFCFEADSWASCIEEIVYLKESIRQTDKVMVDFLNKIRVNEIDDSVKTILKACAKKDYKKENREKIEKGEIKENEKIVPTKIFSLNSNVEEYNMKKLKKLNQKIMVYKMDIEVLDNKYRKDIEKYQKNIPAQEELRICKGAQVMLLKNLDQDAGLVNGSKGVIVDFQEKYPIVLFSNGVSKHIMYESWDIYPGKAASKENINNVSKHVDPVLVFSQVPLRLAYAITCHKSQGMTLDAALIDINDIFENGQAYVAISRVRSLEGLYIKNLVLKNIKAHPKAIEFYRNL